MSKSVSSDMTEESFGMLQSDTQTDINALACLCPIGSNQIL